MEQPAETPFGDVTPPYDDIAAWYFYPYKSAAGFSPDTPLYSVTVVVDKVGEVLVWTFPGEGGVFHSLSPGQADVDQHPPTDEFQKALIMVLSEPGKKHDIERFTDAMYPWEHHFFTVLLNTLNDPTADLPTELHVAIEHAAEDLLDFDVGEALKNGLPRTDMDMFE